MRDVKGPPGWVRAVIVAIVGLTALLLASVACNPFSQGSAGLPAPSGNIAYIRSHLAGDDMGLFAVDVENDQVLGAPITVGRGDHGGGKSMAVSPNGKFYVLRSQLGGGKHPDRGLLILDSSRGWQRSEPPMRDDGSGVAISSDGKAFITRSTLQPDRTLRLDVRDTSDDHLITSLVIPDLIRTFLVDDEGLVYLRHWGNPELDPPVPPGVRVIRSSDLQTVAEISLRRCYGYGLDLGPDGLLYAPVSVRWAADEAEFSSDPRLERAGSLLAIDLDKQQVVAELEVPEGPAGVTITPEGKAYILHVDPFVGSQPSKVSVYDLRERRVLTELPVGRQGTFIKQVSPTKVYAATRGYNQELGKIWVIDTRTDIIVNSFEVGERPEVMALPWPR